MPKWVGTAHMCATCAKAVGDRKVIYNLVEQKGEKMTCYAYSPQGFEVSPTASCGRWEKWPAIRG